MPKTLLLSPTLSVPLDWITYATVVYGNRGTGKTSFGRVAAEEATKCGQRFCAIDLKGDWWGLKSSADGKSDGIPIVIFGGDHADVPLDPSAGAFVGETIANLGQSCVLDFELLSKGKQIRFLAEFFESLYHHNREPLLLLLDEAQRYAPQKPGPDEARTLGAVQDLVKLGRKHGLGPVLFTQRGAGLNKEVSELCDLLVAFRTPGSLDQERIKNWLEANATDDERKSVMSKLSGLATGTAMFASSHPELKLFGVHGVRRPETFDSSATPKVGEKRLEAKKLATPDLAELRRKMSEAIERVKADDPKALRARIAALEEQLKQAVPAVEIIKEVPCVDLGLLNGIRDEMLAEITRLFREATDRAVGRLGPPLERKRAGKTPESAAETKPKQLPPPIKATAADDIGERDPKLGNGGLKRMLTALAQANRPLNRIALALRSGMSPRTGTYSNYLGQGRSAGWIEGKSDFTITSAGITALGKFEPMPTGRGILKWWVLELGSSGASRMLQALAAVYPKKLTRAELAERAGMSTATGTFSNYLGQLRGLGLIEGKSELVACAELFGGAR